MPLQDVQVTIDVLNPAPRVGLGRVLILTEAVGAPAYKEYLSLEALAADHAAGTDAHDKAAAVFAQKNRPDVVAVATYETGAPEASLNAFYNRGWHFALLAGDVAADQLEVATLVDTKGFKFFAAQVADNTGREALADKKRTIIFNHAVDGEHLDAAAVGALGSLPVGSITWKFKGGFAGVTGQYLTETELTEIEADNAIAYVHKAGKAQLSDGVDASGEYIDVLHGRDFVKVDMENEIQHSLQNADKVPYDARGIGLLEAAATTTLQRAYNQGIVAQTADKLADYNIVATPRELQDVQDRADRIYRGLSFDFASAGAIHDVRVQGQIRI